MTVGSFRETGERLSNWGRWGDDDERGTMNLIGPAEIVAAATLVKQGKVFELSIPLASDGPQPGKYNRINPVHLMSIMPGDTNGGDPMTSADDWLITPLQAATQWDALAHVGYDETLYNGVPASSITALGGASRNAIAKLLPGVVGRGVLLDIARLRGVDWLEGGEPIGPEELEAAEHRQGVRLGRGDTLLFRTGWLRKGLTEGWDDWTSTEPGLSIECAEWIHERELAAVVSDNWGIEAMPNDDPETMLPLHCVLIRDMGVTLGEIFNLEELADDVEADGVAEFLFCAPPLRVPSGVGSVVSPIAIK